MTTARKIDGIQCVLQENNNIQQFIRYFCATRAPLLLLALLYTACASGPQERPEHSGPLPGLAPPGEEIAGEVPPNRKIEERELSGEASWYGQPHHGRLTANGETFDMHAFTAAHRTLPFNTLVRVTDVGTYKTVVVRINDRGPSKKRRIIDLSKAAAGELGMISRGIVPVSLEILTWGDGARYRDGRKILPKPKR